MKSTGMRGNLKSRPDLGAKGYEKRGQRHTLDVRENGVYTQGHIFHEAFMPLSVLELRADSALPCYHTRIVLVENHFPFEPEVEFPHISSKVVSNSWGTVQHLGCDEIVSDGRN